MEWLLVLIGGAIGVLAVLFRGRSLGREQAEGKQTKEVLDNVAKAKGVADSVADDSASNRRERLRKHTD